MTTYTHAPHRAKSVVLQVGGMQFASEKNKVEALIGGQPGVLTVEANPVAQTATVTFDLEVTTAEALRERVVECGYHCAGESVPGHVCYVEAPQAQPGEDRSPHAVMGHGSHGEMSMEAMVADTRNRFLVALIFTVPIVLYSPLGRDTLGFTPGTPFGLRYDVLALLLSLLVLFWSGRIFFDGAVAALRRRTLDTMSGSSFLVATNAVFLKRLRLRRQ